MPKSTSNWGATIGLIVALVAMFVLSFAIGSTHQDPDVEEGFGGTDSVVVDMMEESGAEPWFDPIFEPASGEIESGLFAVQAALGAGVVGFVFGNLRGSAKRREEDAEKVPEQTS